MEQGIISAAGIFSFWPKGVLPANAGLSAAFAGYCSPKEHVYSEQTKRKTALSLNQRLSAALFFERGEVNNPPSEDGGFIVTASHGPT